MENNDNLPKWATPNNLLCITWMVRIGNESPLSLSHRAALTPRDSCESLLKILDDAGLYFDVTDMFDRKLTQLEVLGKNKYSHWVIDGLIKAYADTWVSSN